MSNGETFTVVITGNPFFVSTDVSEKEIQSFYGLILTVTGPFTGFFDEQFFMVTLTEMYLKLKSRNHGKAREIFWSEIYPFVEIEDDSSVPEFADYINLPLRVSGCEIINGAIH